MNEHEPNIAEKVAEIEALVAECTTASEWQRGDAIQQRAPWMPSVGLVHNSEGGVHQSCEFRLCT